MFKCQRIAVAIEDETFGRLTGVVSITAIMLIDIDVDKSFNTAAYALQRAARVGRLLCCFSRSY